MTIAALVAAYLVLSAVGEWTTFHPVRHGDGPTPATYGMAYQDVSFRTSDGLTLRGWWIPGSLSRTVVMIHGWTSSRAEPMGRSQYLHAAGYNLLLFDLRGHGTSDGSYTTMGFAEPRDVSAAVGYALERTPGAPVALLGYSMGGALAVEAGARDPRVSAVVDDSGYGSLVAEVRQRFTHVTGLPPAFAAGMLGMASLDLHFNAADVRPAVDAATLHKPLLTIVSGADTMVLPAEVQTVFAAAPGPKQLLLVAGAPHVGGYDRARAQYTATVLSFLTKSLGRTGT